MADYKIYFGFRPVDDPKVAIIFGMIGSGQPLHAFLALSKNGEIQKTSSAFPEVIDGIPIIGTQVNVDVSDVSTHGSN